MGIGRYCKNLKDRIADTIEYQFEVIGKRVVDIIHKIRKLLIIIAAITVLITRSARKRLKGTTNTSSYFLGEYGSSSSYGGSSYGSTSYGATGGSYGTGASSYGTGTSSYGTGASSYGDSSSYGSSSYGSTGGSSHGSTSCYGDTSSSYG